MVFHVNPPRRREDNEYFAQGLQASGLGYATAPRSGE